MSALEQALTDYLQLRHSLGHQLAEAGWLLAVGCQNSATGFDLSRLRPRLAARPG